MIRCWPSEIFVLLAVGAMRSRLIEEFDTGSNLITVAVVITSCELSNFRVCSIVALCGCEQFVSLALGYSASGRRSRGRR